MLQQSASPQLWKALCDALLHMDEQQLRQQILPYVESYLRRWPAEICQAPQSWLERALMGLPTPQLRLARQLKTKDLNAQEIEQLIGCADLHQIQAVYLQNSALSPQLIEALLKAPWSEGLETLYIAHSHIRDEEIEAICELEQLSKLKVLDLRYNRIYDKGAQLLSECAHLKRLELLDLRYNQIGAIGAAKLANSAKLGALKKLDLQCNRLIDQDLSKLLQDKRFAKLTTIELIGFELAPKIAQDLVERDLELYTAEQPSPLVWDRICKLLDRVPERYLSQGLMSWLNERLNHWPDELRTLPDRWLKQILNYHTNSPKLSILRSLDLSQRRISEQATSNLALTSHLRELKHINLEWCNINHDYFETLWLNGFFDAAVTLNLRGNRLPWRVLGAMIEAKRDVLKQVKVLDLSHNYIGNRGIRTLCEIPFEQLRALHLDGAGFNSLAIPSLAEGAHFGALEVLGINENPINEHAQKTLIESEHLPERVKQWWWIDR